MRTVTESGNAMDVLVGEDGRAAIAAGVALMALAKLLRSKMARTPLANVRGTRFPSSEDPTSPSPPP